MLLDYDGTLTPIVSTPDKAVIPPATKRILSKLARIPGCNLTIISGRALKDVRRMVGLSGINYAGNHGLEIRGPKLKFKSRIFSGSKAVIGRIKRRLKKDIRSIKGAFVEDKGLTLSLHYRLVDPGRVAVVKEIFKKTLRPYLAKKMVRVTSGKKVFEVRPPVKWHKGKAALWFIRRERGILKKSPFVFYLGDDVTDEDAFRAVKSRGATIFVGDPGQIAERADKRSGARYYIKGTKEVVRFLKEVIKFLKKR